MTTQTDHAYTLLRIDASAQANDASQSKKLADRFQQAWLKQHPEGQVIHHNLADMSLKHINSDFIGAMYTPEAQRNDAQKQILAESDQWVAELKNADALVISTPMYNFSIPSYLKSYLDTVTRVGETFRYGENGPEGLLNIPKVAVIMTSGGDYTQPPLDAMNFVTPYLQTVLSFNGLDNAIMIEAPGMNMGGEKQLQGLKHAEEQIDQLFNEPLNSRQSA
ncbi:NAD(P)H-dependent oxidoreductase [Thiomicrorhabdus sp. zzn3]|uniref:FMN-dependent NADH-azoreductase n=1 Tax=Thiomicrorhabdus sp. zzn3 TaxID=3039775 RepID=UPI0024370126|nr:NAD(P)H-dependent oxidoreductase [Thiomicrorhabdus sp. zzn3]MDG6778555.1 NAD(P)H-dependent oxidoreductase [Thiomicrorhabdus sp. zzn3]